MENSFQSVGKGRALHLSESGFLYFSRGYDVFRTPVRNPMGTIESCGRLPGRRRRSIPAYLRAAARLLRFEVKALLEVGSNDLVASIREGLFWRSGGNKWTKSSVLPAGALPPKSPMRMSVTDAGHVVWGEYGRNMKRDPVSIYCSRDGGRLYEPVFTFEGGDIRHIHHVIPTAQKDGFWVLSGDYGDEPGIAHLSLDFSALNWVVRGAQSHRAVHVFEESGSLVYGTDTELEKNRIVRLNTETKGIEDTQELNGSSLYGTQIAGYNVLSTTVEPSDINQSRDAEVWLQERDGNWAHILSGRKDWFPGLPFQFGSWVLPTGATNEPFLFVSGQSLKKYDDEILMLDLRKTAFWVE